MANKRRNMINIIRQNENRHVSHMMGTVSSVGVDGKSMSTQVYSDGEARPLNIVLPYGVSSTGMKGMMAQVMINGNDNSSMVGVVDPYRPLVAHGEVMLYNGVGCRIYLKSDGSVNVTSKSKSSITIDANGSIKASTEGGCSIEITNNDDININGKSSGSKISLMSSGDISISGTDRLCSINMLSDGNINIVGKEININGTDVKINGVPQP